MAKQFQGKKNMDVVTYTGNGGTQSISGLDFSPDLVWIKVRNSTESHVLLDTVRGADKVLVSNSSSDEDSQGASWQSQYGNLDSFDSSGFTVSVGSATSYSNFNSNDRNYVAWCWDAGEETVNIPVPVLYDDSQTWSNSMVAKDWDDSAGNFETNYDATNPFNGTFESTGGAAVIGYIRYTHPVAVRVTKLELRTYNACDIELPGGGSGRTSAGLTANRWQEVNIGDGFDFDGSNYIDIKEVGGSGYTYCDGIRINGKELINTGVTGSITGIASTVRAKPEAGFSVVTYSGVGGSYGAFSHGLSSPPVFAFIKSRTNANGWAVYHKSLAQGDNLTLNTDNTYDSYDMFPTAPTDKVFNVSGNGWVNGSSYDYLAYCWSEVPGYSKAGKYTGNGTTSNFIYTGFKPQWILVKRNATSGWVLWDDTRPDTAYLQPNSGNAEAEGLKVNAVSNGFEIANSNGQYNGSGGTYYFMAFAEKPLFRPKRVALEFQDTQDFDEILEGDNLTEYTLAGPGESGKVESKDETTNKVIALADDISTFTTDGTRSMTKPVTDPSNKRWTWSGWVKRSRGEVRQGGVAQTVFRSDRFIIGFDDHDRLYAGVVPVDMYLSTSNAGSTVGQIEGGSTLWTGQDIATNENVVLIVRDHGIAGPRAFYSDPDMNFGFRAGDPGGFYDAAGTNLGNIGSYATYEFAELFTYVNDGTIGTSTYGIATNDNVAYVYMKNYTNTAGRVFQPAIGYGVTTEQEYTDNSTWMHITVTCDTVGGDGFRLYVNGDRVTNLSSELQPGLNYSVPINTTGIQQNIGNTDNYEFSGYVADVQFYDGQAVTPDKIVYNDPTNENRLSPSAPTKWFGTRGYHLDFGDRRSPDLFTQDVSGNDDNWSSSNVSVVGHSEATTAPITETVDNIIPTQYTTTTWNATSGQPLSPATQRPPEGEYRVINLDVTDFNINNAGGYGQLGWSTSNTFNTNQYNTDICGIYLNGDNGDAVYLNPGGPTAIGPAGFTNGAALYKVKDPSGPTGERGWALTNDGTYLTGSIQFIFDGYGNVWLMFNGDYMYANGTTTFDPTSDVMDYTKGVDGFPLWINFPDGQIFGLNTQVGDSSRYTIDTNGFVEGSTLTFSNNTNLEVASVGDTVTQGEVTSTVKSSDVRNKTLTVSDLGFSVNSTVTLNSTLTTGDVDSVVDTPNNYGQDDGLGGEQRGSYGTWNPLDIRDIGTQPTQMWNGNLSWGDRGQSNSYGSIIGNFPMGSGKWYWEITLGEFSAIDSTTYMGIVPLTDVQAPGVQEYWQGNIFSAYADAYSIRAGTNAWTGTGDEQTGYLSGTPADGTVYSFALDADTGNLEVWMDGVSGGTFPFTIPAGKTWVPFVSDWSNNITVGSYTANFGQSPFKYPAPVGYKTLNTNHIEDGLVIQGNTAMDVVLYTGNGGTQTISGLNFSPDLVWIRCRNVERSFILIDSVRGANKFLQGNTADLEVTDSTYVTSFNDDGFSVGSAADVNRPDTPIVAWAWDAGDSDPVLNTTGSLASTVKANPTKGFSIVTWDYSGQTNYTVGHGLGVKPSMIIAKNRTGGNSWRVHHKSLNNNMIVYMDTTGLQENSANIIATPTSSVITTTGNGTGNASGSSVAYCWSEVPGYSAFGSYYGNVSNGDGTIFIHTGFKPRWIMIKQFAGGNNGGGSWVVFDTRRDEFNPLRSALYLNSTQAEDLSYPIGNSLDNGFHITQSSPIWNWDGNVYLYAAFAENPTQYMPQ